MTAAAAGVSDLPRPVADNRADNSIVHATADASYLQLLLDRQPSCLIRVGTDGLLLAVNDAALSLLGGADLKSVLDTTLTERIVPEQRAAWNAFAARVWSDASGSHESEIVRLSGTSRPVMFNGVALSDHPDGIPSILLALRDVSAMRRLEEALQEHTIVRQTADSLRNDLELAIVEQQRLAGLLAEKDVEVQQMLLAHAAEREALVKTLEDHHSQVPAAREEEMRAVHDALRAELDQANVDRQAFQAALDQAAADRQQLEAALEQASIEWRGAAQAVDDRDVDHQRLQAEVTQLVAEGTELKALLERGEIDRQQLVSDLAEASAAREALQTAMAQLKSALEQAAGEHQKLENRLAGTVKAYEQFDATRRKRETTLQKTLAEGVAARSEVERALADARAENTALAKTVADQRVDLKRLDENARELEPLAGSGRLAIELAVEFQKVTAILEAAARALLEQSSLKGPEREQVETIRSSALGVASLARQLAMSKRST